MAKPAAARLMKLLFVFSKNEMLPPPPQASYKVEVNYGGVGLHKKDIRLQTQAGLQVSKCTAAIIYLFCAVVVPYDNF